jgi:hypothetical protein
MAYLSNSLSRKHKILYNPINIVHTRYDPSYEDASDRSIFRTTHDRLYDNSGFYITPNNITKRFLSSSKGLTVRAIS